MTEILSSVRWFWVIAGALAAQAALIAIIYAVSAATALLGWARADFLLLPATIFLVLFLAGVFVARKARGHFTANGFFVGLLAALIYLPVLAAAPPPYPLTEAVNEALKIVGGALGGGLIGHRTRRGIRRRARD